MNYEHCCDRDKVQKVTNIHVHTAYNYDKYATLRGTSITSTYVPLIYVWGNRPTQVNEFMPMLVEIYYDAIQSRNTAEKSPSFNDRWVGANDASAKGILCKAFTSDLPSRLGYYQLTFDQYHRNTWFQTTTKSSVCVSEPLLTAL